MDFSPEQARFLSSATGRDWLIRAASLPLQPATHLRDVGTLREYLSPTEAAAVVEQVLLRRKGTEKFSQATKMLFVREALEQATQGTVAAHRANRFADFERVVDVGCSIGGDSLALAQAGPQVWGVDLDEVRLQFARHNARVYQLHPKMHFLQANGLHLPFGKTTFQAIFADPARRTERGKRTFNPKNYLPPLNILITQYAQHNLAIKVAPGLDFAHVSPTAEIEVVSFKGEVKEMVLWFNALASPDVRRRATLLPDEVTLTDHLPATDAVAPLARYLYEPDGALIRAGLVGQVGATLGLHFIDEHIAYLSGDVAIESPLVKGYELEAILPLKIKAMNRYLQAEDIGRVNVKQRGTGLAPQTVSKKLNPTNSTKERTLILVRFQDEHKVLVGRRF